MLAAMPTSRNSATVHQICKVLRAELPAGLKDYLHSDPDELTKRFQEFLVSVFRVAPRVNESLLREAAEQAFPKQRAEASPWAKMITLAVAHCRKKAHSIAGGLKLAPGTKEVALFLRRQKAREVVPGIPASWAGPPKAKTIDEPANTNHEPTEGKQGKEMQVLEKQKPLRRLGTRLLLGCAAAQRRQRSNTCQWLLRQLRQLRLVQLCVASSYFSVSHLCRFFSQG